MRFAIRAARATREALAAQFRAQAEAAEGSALPADGFGARDALSLADYFARADAGGGGIGDSKPDAFEIDVYDDVMDSYWGVSARYMRAVLKYVQASQINLRINSEGGDVFEGFAIYNLLAQHPANVHASIDCKAFSIASVLAMAADEITMASNAWMMIHNPWGGAQGSADSLRSWADVLDQMREQCADIYAARTGKDRKDILKMMAAETWLPASEAKKMGFCDKIVDLKRGQQPQQVQAQARAFAVLRLDDYSNVPDELRDRVLASRKQTAGRGAQAARDPVPEELELEFASQGAAVPFKKYALKEDGSWDGDAAVARVRKFASSDGSGDSDSIDWAKYRRAFTWYDSDNAESLGSYKLPHHDMVDGKLVTVRAGVIAAGNAVSGSRGGLDIPDGELAAVKSHLAKHYKEFDLTAPWEKGDDAKDSARADSTSTMEGDDTMNKIALAQALGLSQSATDEQIEAAVVSAARDLGNARALVSKLEGLAGKTGDEMHGVVLAWKASHDRLPGLEKQLAEIDAKREDDELESAIRAAKDAQKLSPAMETEIRRQVKDKELTIKGAKAMLSTMAPIPAFVNGRNQTGAASDAAASGTTADAAGEQLGTNAKGELTIEGKSFSELEPAQRAALKKNAPELYAQMKAGNGKRMGKAAA